MKDKRLIISVPILILVAVLHFYIYVRDPFDQEFDKGLMAVILTVCLLIATIYSSKREFIRQIIAIILFLISISIYFLI